jgi:hypothetical protein
LIHYSVLTAGQTFSPFPWHLLNFSQKNQPLGPFPGIMNMEADSDGYCYHDERVSSLFDSIRFPIIGLLKLTQIFFLALVLHRRVHGARFNDYDVDAK